MIVRLLFLAALLFASSCATLHCATKEQSVSLLRATCNADLGCRWFFGKKSMSEFTYEVVQKLQLVRTWDHALASMQSAFHGDDDVRHQFWPQSWRNATPALLTFGAVPVELPDAVSASLNEADCLSLVASLGTASSSSLPPSELRDAVHMLVEYAIFLSDDRQCNPESEVLVLNPDTGDAHCMLATNHVCASSSGTDDTLTTVAIYGAMSILGFIIVMGIAMNIYTYYHTRKTKHLVHEQLLESVPPRVLIV